MVGSIYFSTIPLPPIILPVEIVLTFCLLSVSPVSYNSDNGISTSPVIVSTPKTTPSPQADVSCHGNNSYINCTPRPIHRADFTPYVQKPWYHGDISWEEAKERLKVQGSDCFLVRKSQSQPGKYDLSVSFGGVIKHYPIRVQNQCCEIEGTETSFKSLDKLIVYYKNNYISTQEDVLTTPCQRPTLTPCKKM